MIDFFEFSNEMLCLADHRGYFVKVNPAWTKTLGWSADELTSRPYFDFVHPDDLAATTQEASLLLSGSHETISFENRYRCRDGSYRWLEWRAVLAQGTGQLVATARDVTDQKLQAQALRGSEERFRLLATRAPIGIAQADAEGSIYFANSKWCELANVASQEAALGFSWKEFIHPQDLPAVISHWQSYLQAGMDMPACEFRFLHKNGNFRWVSSSAAMLRDVSGKVVGQIATLEDITERKQGEQRNAVQYAVTRILTEANSLQEATFCILQTICEKLNWVMGDLFVIDSSAGVLRFLQMWNAPHLPFTKFSAKTRNLVVSPGEGVAGRVWANRLPLWIPDIVCDSEFLRSPEALHEGIHAALAFPILVDGEVTGVIEFFSDMVRQEDKDLLVMIGNLGNQIGQFIRRKHAEEELRSQYKLLEVSNSDLEGRVETRAKELREANEKLRIEIQERARTEEKLHEQQSQLAHVSRLSTIGEMAAELAHEINQPLSAVGNYLYGALHSLRPGDLVSEELIATLRQVEIEAARAIKIMRRVRNFTRRGEPQPEEVSLNDLVGRMFRLTSAEARHRNIEMSIELDEKLPKILVDPLQIEQVVVNLVRNAFDALKEEYGVAGHVVLKTYHRDDSVEVAIRDNGPGVAEDKRERIFDPYYTNKADGLGLGLAISRTIIEAHHGRLWVEPSFPRGTTFRFSLPIVQEPEP